MDPKGRVWGVENGVDNLARFLFGFYLLFFLSHSHLLLFSTDLGGDIHSNNPGEELNLLEEGVFYGYPYCWSEYDLASYNSDWDVQQTRLKIYLNVHRNIPRGVYCLIDSHKF